MSIHKLTAGSGYDYLTRQVAALDATAKGHTGLTSYYVDGLDAGEAVTSQQMRSLFGAGMHPLATQAVPT